MRIIEHTPTILKLQQEDRFNPLFFNPLFFALKLHLSFFGIMSFLFGLAIILADLPKALDCKRIESSQVNCELVSSGLLGEKITDIKLLQGAEIKKYTDSDGDISYRMVLISEEKKINLGASSTKKRRQTSQINDFVDNSEKLSLKILFDYNPFDNYAGGGIGLLAGWLMMYFLFFHPIPTLCVFNKTSGTMYLEYRNGLNLVSIREEKLNTIEMTKIHVTQDMNGGECYTMKLLLKTGKFISFNPWFYSGSWESETSIKNAINQFLDLDKENDTI